jgi:hypothetical protein
MSSGVIAASPLAETGENRLKSVGAGRPAI